MRETHKSMFANGIQIIGCGCIVCGVWFIYWPAAVVIAGVAMILVSIGLGNDNNS